MTFKHSTNHLDAFILASELPSDHNLNTWSLEELLELYSRALVANNTLATVIEKIILETPFSKQDLLEEIKKHWPCRIILLGKLKEKDYSFEEWQNIYNGTEDVPALRALALEKMFFLAETENQFKQWIVLYYRTTGAKKQEVLEKIYAAVSDIWDWFEVMELSQNRDGIVENENHPTILHALSVLKKIPSTEENIYFWIELYNRSSHRSKGAKLALEKISASPASFEKLMEHLDTVSGRSLKLFQTIFPLAFTQANDHEKLRVLAKGICLRYLFEKETRKTLKALARQAKDFDEWLELVYLATDHFWSNKKSRFVATAMRQLRDAAKTFDQWYTVCSVASKLGQPALVNQAITQLKAMEIPERFLAGYLDKAWPHDPTLYALIVEKSKKAASA